MDLLFTKDQLEDFLRRQSVPLTAVRTEDVRTTNSFATVGNGDWWKYRDYLHQETMFRMLGFRPDQIHTLDVDDYEHAELIFDLNKPVGSAFGEFDLILDLGTLEHVFDVRQALWNLGDLCRAGGQVVHMSPVNFLNHGFYNFTATLFSDYYEQAGWTQDDLFYALFPDLGGETTLYARVEADKLAVVPSGVYINVVARYRKQDVSVKPIASQNLYGGVYEAWNHQSRPEMEAPRPLPAVPAHRKWVEALRRSIRRTKARRHLAALDARPIDLS